MHSARRSIRSAVDACGCWKHRKWLAHPGELAAAEAFAADVQLQALAPLPAAVRGRVIIAATAHTDEATFLYNQPIIEPLPGTESF